MPKTHTKNDEREVAITDEYIDQIISEAYGTQEDKRRSSDEWQWLGDGNYKKKPIFYD